MTTWNPADLSNITLSNGNLTAANTASSNSFVRGTTSKASGLIYWEINVDVRTGSFETPGIANASYTVSQNIPGFDSGSNSLGINAGDCHILTGGGGTLGQVISGVAGINAGGPVSDWATSFDWLKEPDRFCHCKKCFSARRGWVRLYICPRCGSMKCAHGLDHTRPCRDDYPSTVRALSPLGADGAVGG